MPHRRKFEIQYTRTVVMTAVVELETDPNDLDSPHGTDYRGELPGVYAGIPAELIGEHVQEVTDWNELYEHYPIGEPYEAVEETAPQQTSMFEA